VKEKEGLTMKLEDGEVVTMKEEGLTLTMERGNDGGG